MLETTTPAHPEGQEGRHGLARPGLGALALAARTRSRPDLVAAVPWLLLAVLLAVDATLQPEVFTLSNLGIVALGALPLVLVAAGQTVVILTGGIDLSVAGTISLVSAVMATRSTPDTVVVWCLVAVALGALCGLVNGLVVTRLGMQPFIVTLATWSILSGIALLVLPTQGGSVPEALVSSLNGSILGVPRPVWMVLLVVAVWAWARRTRLLRRIYAVGSNRQAAALAGARPGRSLVAAYVICAMLAAAAGIAYTIQTASGDPVGGNAFQLNSVAAVVIGGTRLSGGRGGLLGTVAGALVLVYIADVVFAVGLSSFWTPLIQGALLIAAVLVRSAADVLHNRRTAQP